MVPTPIQSKCTRLPNAAGSANTPDHLDLFSYIGGFSGAGGMLVLRDRKLDTKTAV